MYIKGVRVKRMEQKERAMCEAMNNLMKDELDARESRGEARGMQLGETRGAEKLKEAILAIKSGKRPSDVKKEFGKDIFEAANDVMKSFA